jgi:hypothetical protein
MKADGMNRATTIFHKALEVALEKRSDFLAEACAGDSQLQAHVQELIDSAEETNSFAEALLGDRVLPPQSTLPIFAAGEVVGTRYEVIRFIAKGGMGEVYEVEDKELGSAAQKNSWICWGWNFRFLPVRMQPILPCFTH